MIPNVSSYMDLAEDYVLAYLLPDTCQIYPTIYANDGAGSETQTQGAYRTYKGSTSIPCRIDQTKQYRESNIYLQETTPTNYYMSLPADSMVDPDDTIIHNGNTYQIRELYDDSSWRSVKKALIMGTR